MKSASWFSLIELILKHGDLTIPSYDYEKFRQTELQKLSPLISADTIHSKTRFSLAKSLLPIPILGPLVALTSYYKVQKRWPTYIYHWPEKKLAYVRISKSACTSIQAALLQARYTDVDVSKLNVNQINYLGMPYLKPGLSSGYTCFTVVREPVNRLISCYYDKCLPSGRDFYYYQDYLFSIIKPNISIDQFLAIINEIPDFLKDVHFRPQSYFLKSLSGVKIFKLEDDLTALKAFLHSYNLSLKHLHQNKAKKLTIQDLSQESKKLLKSIYQEDFQSFNYPVNF